MINRIPIHWFPLLLALGAILEAAPEIDPGNRWQIRDYYNAVYIEGNSVEMAWTGDYATGLAGTISPSWQAALCERVAFYRNMAGVPADVTLTPDRNAAAQEAALMMSMQGSISHFPDQEWADWGTQPWHTIAGAQAASRSNLASGATGPEAVEGYMIDFGSHNWNVGHRRWLLLPQLTEMGNGDVPGNPALGYPATNALWLIPDSVGPRPATRDEFVAWPPSGYVPAPLVFARWSFSLPGADFSSASVQMRSNGQAIPLALEPLDSRIVGEPTLVWVPDGLPTDTRGSWPLPDEDETIEVTLNNVLVQGEAQSFSYEVIIFNPDKAGPEEFPTMATINGPVHPGVPAAFPVPTRAWSEGIQGRLIRAVPYTEALDAENGLGSFTASISSGYSGIQTGRVAEGNAAYHLAYPEIRPQILTLEHEFIIWPGPASLGFDSSLAWATQIQVASVEINLGSEESWRMIWSTRGPVEANGAFTHVEIDLSPWQGQTARFRFRYDTDGFDSYWINTEDAFGWAIDNIELRNISRVTGIEELPPVMGTSSIEFTVENDEPLYLQVREFAFEGYPLNWGPVREVIPEDPDTVVSQPGTWALDPIMGWTWGTVDPWTYILHLGWTYTETFPWVYTGSGWFFYQRGSMASGLWLHHPEHGYCYAHEDFGQWFVFAPWDGASWRRFGG